VGVLVGLEKVGVDLDVDLGTDLHMDLVYSQHAC